jgi:hypothetical protein
MDQQKIDEFIYLHEQASHKLRLIKLSRKLSGVDPKKVAKSTSELLNEYIEVMQIISKPVLEPILLELGVVDYDAFMNEHPTELHDSSH